MGEEEGCRKVGTEGRYAYVKLKWLESVLKCPRQCSKGSISRSTSFEEWGWLLEDVNGRIL